MGIYFLAISIIIINQNYFLISCPFNKVCMNWCCTIIVSSSREDLCHSWRENNAQLSGQTSWLSPSHGDSGVIQQVECNAWWSTLRDLHAYALTCLSLSGSFSLHVAAKRTSQPVSPFLYLLLELVGHDTRSTFFFLNCHLPKLTFLQLWCLCSCQYNI